MEHSGASLAAPRTGAGEPRAGAAIHQEVQALRATLRELSQKLSVLAAENERLRKVALTSVTEHIERDKRTSGEDIMSKGIFDRFNLLISDHKLITEQNDVLRAQLHDALEYCVDVEGRVRSLRAQLQDERARLHALEAHAAAESRERAAQEKSARMYSERLSALDAKFQKCAGTRDALRKQLAQAEARLRQRLTRAPLFSDAALADELAELAKRADALERGLAAERKDAAELRMALVRAERRAAELERYEAAAKAAQSVPLPAAAEEAPTSAQAASVPPALPPRMQAEDPSEVTRRLFACAHASVGELEHTRVRLASAEAERDRLRTELARMLRPEAAERNGLAEEVAVLKETGDAVRQKATGLAQENAKLREKLARAQRRCEQLTEAAASNTRRAGAEERHLERALRDKASAVSEVAHLRQLLARERARVCEAASLSQAQEARRARAVAALEDKVVRLGRALAESRETTVAMCTAARRRQNAAEAQLAAAKKKTQKLREMLRLVTEQLESHGSGSAAPRASKGK